MLRVDYAAVGSRIREQRKRTGMTQASLAEALSVTPQFVGMLERGERVTTLDVLISLCYVLDVPVEYLLQDSLPESLFKHYSSSGGVSTLRSVMVTMRRLSDMLPPERPNFLPPDAPATPEDLARIPFAPYPSPDQPKPKRKRSTADAPIKKSSYEYRTSGGAAKGGRK